MFAGSLWRNTFPGVLDEVPDAHHSHKPVGSDRWKMPTGPALGHPMPRSRRGGRVIDPFL